MSANTVKLQQHVHKATAKGIGLHDRGMKRANFAVVRETNMPALLIEYGFISNLNDEKIISNEIDKQAQLTLQGINSYYGITTKPAGPSPTPVLKKESDEIILNETGRMEIRTLLKKAHTKTYQVNGEEVSIINPSIPNSKIEQYSDAQLLSYQVAIINRSF